MRILHQLQQAIKIQHRYIVWYNLYTTKYNIIHYEWKQERLKIIQ